MLRLINLRCVVLLIVLEFGVASQVPGQAASVAESGHHPADSPASDHPAVVVHNHSVKLSWRASTPASKLPRDVVVGYNVYRSTKSHDRDPQRINSKLCADTAYTDTDIKAGKTYYYVTRGVTAKGVESGSSNETKVVIPSP